MIKAAIIGCGNVAWKWDNPKSIYVNTHAKAYYKNRKVLLAACCDYNFANAHGLAKVYPGVTPYRDYKAMLAKEKLDIVSVCTPPPTHYKILEYLLAKTDVKYILAEKPLASGVRQVQRLTCLAKKRKVCIVVNYLRRWDKTITTLKHMLSTVGPGAFQFGSCVYYGGIKHNGIHLIDFLLFLGFRPTFKAFLSKPRRYDGDFAASFLLEDRRAGPFYFHWIH
ncbi:MAG: Gfo/Idh/MocA family oxidoreductase, partial [Candidatus Omnitrophota bacterium]